MLCCHRCATCPFMAATLAPPGNETQVASATCLVLPSSSNRQAALLHIRSICTAAAAGKPYRELCELESGIQEQLDSGTAADPEYWQVRDGWREAVLLLMLLPPERSSAAFMLLPPQMMLLGSSQCSLRRLRCAAWLHMHLALSSFCTLAKWQCACSRIPPAALERLAASTAASTAASASAGRAASERMRLLPTTLLPAGGAQAAGAAQGQGAAAGDPWRWVKSAGSCWRLA